MNLSKVIVRMTSNMFNNTSLLIKKQPLFVAQVHVFAGGVQ